MAEGAAYKNYESARAAFRLETPADYNFAFDVIERRARDADKTAFIAVDRAGKNVVHYAFSELDASANRLANVLLGLGAGKGDFAFVMIPRVSAWYQVMIACMKLGVVTMPGTNMLMPKDIEYRINKAGARIAIVAADGVAKIEDIRARCPTLEIFIVTGGEGQGEGEDWVSMEAACEAVSDKLNRADVAPTRADDLMLVYFTSGTTSMPKMVPRDFSYALGHTLTGRYWLDVGEGDVHWTLADTGWAKAAWGCLFSPWLMG
ncbi:MAG TPA: AMP-binding protein, partial [Rhodospirillales bacterium]|nr:AMP-binding protein [Rhodospirillales bacterium]